MIGAVDDRQPACALVPGDVHLWWISLAQPDEQRQGLQELLQADERERFDRIRDADARGRRLVARAALRSILAQYLPEHPAELTFDYGPYGKPSLRQWPAIGFNLSHANGVALCAVTRDRSIGVDIEYRRRLVDGDAVARRFFAAEEYAVYASLPADQREVGFFNAWTRKEAFIKAIGDGLSRPLHEFVVSLRPGEAARLLAIEAAPEDVARWTLVDLPCPPGYTAALAVDGGHVALRHLTWPDDVKSKPDPRSSAPAMVERYRRC